MSDDEPIDTINDQIVGVIGGRVTVMLPLREMTPTQARRHAAWLFVMANAIDGRPTSYVADVIRAVEQS